MLFNYLRLNLEVNLIVHFFTFAENYKSGTRHHSSPSSSSSTLRSRSGSKVKARDDNDGLLAGIIIGACTGAFLLMALVKLLVPYQINFHLEASCNMSFIHAVTELYCVYIYEVITLAFEVITPKTQRSTMAGM